MDIYTTVEQVPIKKYLGVNFDILFWIVLAKILINLELKFINFGEK